jgi:hypothetical protein
MRIHANYCYITVEIVVCPLSNERETCTQWVRKLVRVIKCGTWRKTNSRGAPLLDFRPSRKLFMELPNAVMRNTHLSTRQSCDNTRDVSTLDFCLIEGQIIRWGGNAIYRELA